ncbi:MAG: hypothetical protein GXP38_14700, partial [Chloroflexi bacterium]|nr:hypothetical protein [Chloroflexota bacterium]
MDFRRPLRVPDNVPLRMADPPLARAGERGRWRLQFEIETKVGGGVLVGIQFHGGRYNKLVWPRLQSHDPLALGHVSCRIGEEQFPLQPAQYDPGSFYFRAPSAGIPPGATVEVFLGGEMGTVAPEYALENKFFLLFLPDPTPPAKIPGLRQDPRRQVLAACLMHITGSKKHHLRIIAPSFVTAGEPLRLLVRPEDQWGNVA